ncbi:MAG: hypothetical protein VW274_09650, partial [Thalassolituus sp.]
DSNRKTIADVKSALSSASGASSSDVSSLKSQQKALQSRMTELEASMSSVPSQLELAIAQNKESLDLLDGSVASLRSKLDGLKGGTGGSSADLLNMKLEIEDIQIRLDRIQNAMSGSGR